MVGTAAVPEDLLSWDFTQDPYTAYRRMRHQAPAQRAVVKTLTVELNAWVVTRYDEVRELLADQRLSKDAAGLPRIVERNKVGTEPVPMANFQSMLFSDPPDHTRLRRIMGRAFTMRRVQHLRPSIERATDTLLDAMQPGAEVDLISALAMPLPISVIGTLLGVPEENQGMFRAWNAVLSSIDASMQDKQQAHLAAIAFLTELIRQKRARPGEDLISALAQPAEGDPALDDGELLATVFLVMNAGYETTASMLGNSVHALLLDPPLQAWLREDPGRIPAAVEEFLRYESPLNLATVRYATEPVRLGDVQIETDDLVFVSLAAANRDPSRFTEPDVLDLGRAGSAGHLAFGHGIHHCVGAPLARMEGEIALAKLLQRFSQWQLAVPATELRWRNSLQFRALERLPVQLG
jgi:cytochrome P450